MKHAVKLYLRRKKFTMKHVIIKQVSINLNTCDIKSQHLKNGSEEKEAVFNVLYEKLHTEKKLS